MDRPKYRIEIFWSDEDGGYIANVPDLVYCSAFGETYEEALREVLVAMELHLDTLQELNRQIPEPTSYQESEIEGVGHRPDQVGQGIVVRTGDYVMEFFRTAEAAESVGQEVREALRAGQEARETLRTVRDAAEQAETLEAIRDAAEQALEQINEAADVHAEAIRSVFPIPNYDELNVEEVSKTLDGLTAAEIRAVREYEKRHKSRETLIERLDRRLGA